MRLEKRANVRPADLPDPWDGANIYSHLTRPHGGREHHEEAAKRAQSKSALLALAGRPQKH